MASGYDSEGQYWSVHQTHWDQPDDAFRSAPTLLNKEKWGEACLTPKIGSEVPAQIKAEFERARGAVLYGGWYFYGLATLGMDHCWRILELAVRLRCEKMGKPSDRFYDNIETLTGEAMLNRETAQKLHAARNMRNDRSHLNSGFLWDPPGCLSHLVWTAGIINQIWET